MSEVADGGPAFPWGEGGQVLGGVSVRDYFTVKAMQSMLSGDYQFMHHVADDAYQMLC